MRRRGWFAGVAVAAVLIAACEAADPSDPAKDEGLSPRGDTQPAATAPADVAGELSLDWFVRLQEEIGRPERDLYSGYMERCMADAGFSWQAPQPPTIPTEWEEIARYPARYGVVTLTQAERAAYLSPDEVFFDLSSEEADNEGLPSDPAEFDAFQAAWFGTEAEVGPEDLVVVSDPVTGEPILAFDPSSPRGGGCVGRANAWLSGETSEAGSLDIATDVGTARAWIDVRIRASFDQALADDRVVAVAERWRACMAERGWEAPEWQFPGGLTVDRPGSGAASDEQTAAERERLEKEAGNTARAVDDVRCQDQVEWLVSLRKVEAEYQQETVERVPDRFAEVRDLIAAYRARLATLRLADLDG
jgi:hypothetical protein